MGQIWYLMKSIQPEGTKSVKNSKVELPGLEIVLRAVGWSKVSEQKGVRVCLVR